MKKLINNRTATMLRWDKVCALLLAAITLLSFGLIGCGGSGAGTGTGAGGSSLPPLPTFVPGTVSDTNRQAAYTQVQAFFQTVIGQSTAAAQIVAKMKTMPQFATAEISASGDAVGWFKDGLMYVCITSDPVYRPQPAGFSLPTPSVQKAKPADLTASTTAYLVNSFEPARPDITASVTPLLTAKGYNVIPLVGHVTDFATIKNAGLLFVHAHGVIETDMHRVQRFWYTTSDSPSSALDKTYAAYISKGTLGVGSGPVWDGHGNFPIELRYVVNDEFLHDSGMTFANNATWISQSCSSYNPAMLQAVMDPSLGFAGVNQYSGWTLPEDSWESTSTSSFIFDRLLGVNAVAPIDPTNPPPADFVTLANLLTNTTRPFGGLPYDESTQPDTGTSYFKFASRTGTNVPTIIPVITGSVVDVNAQTLTLSGFFGAQPGTVVLDLTPLTVQSWSETSIVLAIPTGTSGSLVVHSLGGTNPSDFLWSNLFAYTKLALAISPPGGTYAHSANATFTVVTTAGTLPPGVTYRWTLTGKGTLPAGNPAVTKGTDIYYVAPSVDSVDSLKVEALNTNGTTVATATAAISVGSPTLVYTASGNVTSETYLTDGNYVEPYINAYHIAMTGHDLCDIGFLDPVSTNSMNILISLAPGAQLFNGESFNTNRNAGPGWFNLGPGTAGVSGSFIAVSGSLTITSAVNNGDGTYTYGCSFNAVDANGGTLSGGGQFLFHYTYDTAP